MEAKQYYEVVSVKDELPDKEGKYTVFTKHSDCTCIRVFTGTQFENYDGYATTHFLRPVSGILLSQVEYDGLMKCVEALRDIADPMKKIRENAEAEGSVVNGMMAIQLCKDGNWLSDKAKQTLSQLPETLKQNK